MVRSNLYRNTAATLWRVAIMQIKSVVPAVFFFAVGLAASYIFAILLGLLVFTSLQGDDPMESSTF